MALQINYEDARGITHPDAYIRVQKVIIEKLAGQDPNVTIDVVLYASKAARDAGKIPVWGPQGHMVQKLAAEQPKDPKEPPIWECAVNPDTVTIADCYVWLKTQDKFKEALDV